MPASCLKIGGEKVEDAILDLVTVRHELNRHSWCEVECRQTADKRFPIEDRLGQELELSTYTPEGTERVIFSGFVLEGRLEYEVYGSYRVHLKAVSSSYRLDVASRESYHRQAKLKDVAETLCGQNQLSVAVKCEALEPKNYVQWGEAGWAFLLRIADQHKAYVKAVRGGLEIRDAFETGSKVEWRADDAQGLLSFQLRGSLQASSMSGTYYDEKLMKSETMEAVKKEPEWWSGGARMVGAVKRESATKLPGAYEHEDARVKAAGEYKALLERGAERGLGTAVMGHGVSRQEGLEVGKTVKVEGVLDGAGEYGIVKLEHRWNKQGYQNEFWCTPWKRWMEPEAPRVRKMNGAAVARVSAHNDPRKMGRIQVAYDWQEQGTTSWVRMAAPHAGADRGFMFMPEIGDEVLLMFEQGDLERPYVVGCLWNGVDTAPRDEFWGGELEANDVKRIVTKSGHRIQLVDTPGKESISIATPNHTRITLYEKADETNRSAIVIHNETGDIVFTAPQGRVHLQAKYFSREVGVQASGGKDSPPAPNQPRSNTVPSNASPKGMAAKASSVIATAAVAGVAQKPLTQRVSEFWEKGKPVPVEKKTFTPSAKAMWSRENEFKSWSTEKKEEKDPKTKFEPGAKLSWTKTEGAAKRWGDDADNIQLGAYQTDLSSGIKRKDDGFRVDAISASASGAVLKGRAKEKYFGEFAEVKAEGEVLSGEVKARLGAEWSKKEKVAQAEVGAEVNLAKGELGGDIRIPIPFTKHFLTLGGTLEGQAGASAVAKAAAGWTEAEGYVFTAKAKAALLVGGGAGFKIGLK